MANRTVYDAKAIHGTNPQYLVEKIMRARIYESLYWKEHCFALTAETLVDKAVELTAIGGHYGGNMKPTEFMCLVLKMLQLQPDKEIVKEYVSQEDFKYLRALGAYYVRLTFQPEEVYSQLEPLLEDFRKLRRRTIDGGMEIVHVDEFMDDLLREERVCDVQLPRIAKRAVLEEQGLLVPRSIDIEDLMDEEEKERAKNGENRSPTRSSNGSAREDDEAESFLRRQLAESESANVSRKGGNGRQPEGRRNGRREVLEDRSPSPARGSRGRDSSRDRSASPYGRDRGERDRRSHSRERGREGERQRSRSWSPEKDSGRDFYEERRERKETGRAALEKKVSQMFKGGGKSDKKKPAKEEREVRESGGGGGGGNESMSIEETNKLRISLGLKPLQ